VRRFRKRVADRIRVQAISNRALEHAQNHSQNCSTPCHQHRQPQRQGEGGAQEYQYRRQHGNTPGANGAEAYADRALASAREFRWGRPSAESPVTDHQRDGAFRLLHQCLRSVDASLTRDPQGPGRRDKGSSALALRVSTYALKCC